MNDGRASYLGYSFDASGSPEHAEVRRVVLSLLADLRRAGHTGAAPSRDTLPLSRLAPEVETHSRDALALSRLVETHPQPRAAASAEELRAEVARLKRVKSETLAEIARLERIASEAVLVALCRATLDYYFTDPNVEGYRVLGRCRRCRRWFFEAHARQAYCRPSCRRLRERALTRSRVQRYRRRSA